MRMRTCVYVCVYAYACVMQSPPRTAKEERSAAASQARPPHGEGPQRWDGGSTYGGGGKKGTRGEGPERPPGSGDGGSAAFGFASLASEARGRPGRGLSADPPYGRSLLRGWEHAGWRSEPLRSRSRGVGLGWATVPLRGPGARPVQAGCPSSPLSSRECGVPGAGGGRPSLGGVSVTGRDRQRATKTVRCVVERCVPPGFVNGGLAWQKESGVVHPQL